jgi:hypothetical protein
MNQPYCHHPPQNLTQPELCIKIAVGDFGKQAKRACSNERVEAPFLYPDGNNIFDTEFPFWFCHTVELLVALPQIQYVTYGSEPHFVFGEAQMRSAVI